jgi:glyoxylase-like metal-dependent hydrolase (beta-lactamase superfamily II)
MQEIAPGLRRWTAFHDHWEEDVGSVAVDTADGLVLIDPLDPPAALPRPKHVLLTLYYHARAAAGLKARVWAPARSHRPLRNRGIEAEEAVAGELPGGIIPFPTARAGESVYWLPEHRAVVVGDVLLGAGAKPRATDEPLSLCPQRWLGKPTLEDLRTSLRPLLELPVEHVLVSHGQPVVGNGKRELARALT